VLGRHKYALVAALGVGLLLVWPSKMAPRLVFLSVGQGDCAVWHDGQSTILIDVGPVSRQGYDAGERIVLPKLRRMGIRSVDIIFITHPDSDHIGGLAAIVRRFPAARIAASAEFMDNPQMKWWLQDAGIATSKVIWIDGNWKIGLPNSELAIAAPKSLPGASDNDGSLFIRIKRGESTTVLTGDASMAVEEKMQANLDWKAQVLKVGHHGSRTSTSESFIRKLGPTYAIISCGRDNPFGHPHKSVLDVLSRQGTEILRTDLGGDVVFEPKAFGFTLVR
jgi:competence protein ComEC